MSDGKASHAGLLRASMKAIVETLRTDATMIENDVEIFYKLDHPSKRIEGGIHRITLMVEPAGFSQITGQGVLDLQYFTWIHLKCNPNRMGVDEEDSLTYVCEYLTDMLHRKVWGGMSTYVSRVLLNDKSCDVTANHRSTTVKLEEGELGALIWLWHSPKTIEQIEAENMSEYESATSVKIISGGEE